MSPPAATTEGKQAVQGAAVVGRELAVSISVAGLLSFIPRGLKHQKSTSQKQHRSLAAGQPLPHGCAWRGAGTQVAQGAAACGVIPEPLGQDWPWHFLIKKPRGGARRVSVSGRQDARPR